ncbi:unnamed protein product, partial [Trichogramma brassicae]
MSVDFGFTDLEIENAKIFLFEAMQYAANKFVSDHRYQIKQADAADFNIMFESAAEFLRDLPNLFDRRYFTELPTTKSGNPARTARVKPVVQNNGLRRKRYTTCLQNARATSRKKRSARRAMVARFQIRGRRRRGSDTRRGTPQTRERHDPMRRGTRSSYATPRERPTTRCFDWMFSTTAKNARKRREEKALQSGELSERRNEGEAQSGHENIASPDPKPMETSIDQEQRPD